MHAGAIGIAPRNNIHIYVTNNKSVTRSISVDAIFAAVEDNDVEPRD